MKKGNPTEYRWALWVAVGIMALASIPYLIGYAVTPTGYHFLGFSRNIDDAFVYLSWMRQAADGHFFLRNLFTTEPQSGRGFNLLFFALGSLARLTHLPLIAVFHLARIASGIGLLLAVYGMSGLWLKDIRARRIGLLIVGLSAGIGWMFQGRSAVDRWQPEAITFLSVYLSPLYSFPTLLMVGSLYFLLRYAKTKAPRYAVYAGLALFLLANVHTYDIIPLGIAWVLYAGYRLAGKDSRPLLGGLIALAIAAPSVAYQIYFYSIDQVFQLRAAIPTTSLGIKWYAAGYGLLIPLALYGIWRSVKERNDSGLLVCWAAAGFIASYLPVTFQRKLIMGTHVPLSLLAALGVIGLLEYIPARWQTLVCIPLIGLLSITNLGFLSKDIVSAMSNEAPTIAHVPYASDDEMAALEYVRTHTRPDDLILAPPPTAAIIPGLTGRPVYCGHWGETVDFTRKVREAYAFYSTEPIYDERLIFLREHGFSYVLGYHGAAQLVDLDTQPAPYLKPVFQSPEVTVYRVELP